MCKDSKVASGDCRLHGAPVPPGSSPLSDEDIDQVDYVIIDQSVPELIGTDMLLEIERRGLALPSVLITGAPSPVITAVAERLGLDPASCQTASRPSAWSHSVERATIQIGRILPQCQNVVLDKAIRQRGALRRDVSVIKIQCVVCHRRSSDSAHTISGPCGTSRS